MKPYITIKDGPYGEFQATRVHIGIDEYSGGNPMFCVVGYDDNHGKYKNIYGSSVLDNVLSHLIGYSGELAKVMAQDAIEKWNIENEIEE